MPRPVRPTLFSHTQDLPPDAPPFYCLYAHGSQRPRIVHLTLDAAYVEAHRLARHLGRAVYVLSSMGAVMPPPTNGQPM
jgi:hypothetical protein